MKKFLSLILALAMMLGLVANANMAAKAVTAEATVTVNYTTDNPVDTTEEAKVSEWFCGYRLRCLRWQHKRAIGLRKAARKRLIRRAGTVLKMAAMLPMTLLLGVSVASAEAAEPAEKPKVRESRKLTTKLRRDGANVVMYEEDSIFEYSFVAAIQEVKNFWKQFKDSPREKRDWTAFNNAKEALNKVRRLIHDGKVFRPITGKKGRRIVRLSRIVLLDVLNVNYDDREPVSDVIIVRHAINEIADLPLGLFGKDRTKGKQLRKEFMCSIFNVLIRQGLVVNGTRFVAIASSASHQKQMKILMISESAAKQHEKLFWFGKTQREFLAKHRISGAQYWKIMAIFLRPESEPFMTADGETISYKDILVVKDVEISLSSDNTRTIGGTYKDEKGNIRHWTSGAAKFVRVFADGEILFVIPIRNQGQVTLLGFKGFGADATSALKFIADELGVTIEELLDMEIPDADGNMCRIGDYKAICGDGCFKFGKCFDSISEYRAWMSEMEDLYPGIGLAYILRQAEENEDDYRPRSMAKTMLQQFVDVSWADAYKLVRGSVRHLNRMRTFSGALKRLSGEGKDPDELSFSEKAFREIPELLLNSTVLEEIHGMWRKDLIRAISGKIRTQGQYPYLMEDPVAVLQVWLGLKDVNDPSLGILRGDQISAADVEDGRKVVFLRYPANYQTAMVMTNVVHDAFESVNNACVVSVHSLVLVIQDGDVDGDEAGLWYDEKLVELVERMRAEYQPPIILFKHGEGAKADKPYENLAGFKYEIACALWRSKEFDTVGKDAIGSNAAAYLAAYARTMGDYEAMDLYLLWMSACSTGAIMSIDQVKGNAVDEALIQWIEVIHKAIRKKLQEIAIEYNISYKEAKLVKYPRAHYWGSLAKNDPVLEDECLPHDTTCIMGKIEAWITSRCAYNMDIDDVDEFMRRFDTENEVYNEGEILGRLLSGLESYSIRKAVLPESSKELFGNNWVNKLAREDNGNKSGGKVVAAIDAGNPVGLAELMDALWYNLNAIYMVMPGETMADKKAEYYAACRQILFSMLEQDNSVITKNGHTYTLRDKQRVMADNALIRAMHVGKYRGDASVRFTLEVFAPEYAENLRRTEMSNTDKAKFGRIMAKLKSDEACDFEPTEDIPEHPDDVAVGFSRFNHEDIYTNACEGECVDVDPTDEDLAEASQVQYDLSEDEREYEAMMASGAFDEDSCW